MKIWKFFVSLFSSKKEPMISDEDLKSYKGYLETMKKSFLDERAALEATGEIKYKELYLAYDFMVMMVNGPLEAIEKIKTAQDEIRLKK